MSCSACFWAIRPQCQCPAKLNQDGEKKKKDRRPGLFKRPPCAPLLCAESLRKRSVAQSHHLGAEAWSNGIAKPETRPASVHTRRRRRAARLFVCKGGLLQERESAPRGAPRAVRLPRWPRRRRDGGGTRGACPSSVESARGPRGCCRGAAIVAALRARRGVVWCGWWSVTPAASSSAGRGAPRGSSRRWTGWRAWPGSAPRSRGSARRRAPERIGRWRWHHRAHMRARASCHLVVRRRPPLHNDNDAQRPNRAPERMASGRAHDLAAAELELELEEAALEGRHDGTLLFWLLLLLVSSTGWGCPL